jgi:phage gpG-like protein
MPVTVTKDITKDIAAATRKLAATRVMVGIPAIKAGRDDGEPINNAELGYIHENGAPEAHIPARPFLMPGINNKVEVITDQLEAAGRAALEGNAISMNRYLNAAGLVGADAVKRKITTGPFVPLAESTLAARRRRGRTGTKPLLDTGQLRAAITYVIRKV